MFSFLSSSPIPPASSISFASCLRMLSGILYDELVAVLSVSETFFAEGCGVIAPNCEYEWGWRNTKC